MKNFQFLLILILGSLVFPLISLAGSYTADTGISSTTITYDGLVPCGKCATTTPAPSPEPTIGTLDTAEKCKDGGYYWRGGECYYCPNSDQRLIPCQFCHLIIMLDGVIDFLLVKILFPLALLMLVIAGILYIGAAFEFLPGGFKTFTQAKKIIASVVIGLIVIVLGYFISAAFLNIVGLADWARDIYKSGLININCPIKL